VQSNKILAIKSRLDLQAIAAAAAATTTTTTTIRVSQHQKGKTSKDLPIWIYWSKR